MKMYLSHLISKEIFDACILEDGLADVDCDACHGFSLYPDLNRYIVGAAYTDAEPQSNWVSCGIKVTRVCQRHLAGHWHEDAEF